MLRRTSFIGGLLLGLLGQVHPGCHGWTTPGCMHLSACLAPAQRLAPGDGSYGLHHVVELAFEDISFGRADGEPVHFDFLDLSSEWRIDARHVRSCEQPVLLYFLQLCAQSSSTGPFDRRSCFG